MTLRHLLSIYIFAACALGASAQHEGTSWFKRNHVADGLEAAFTLGTTGIGVEVATPVTRWTKLRVGFDGTPAFKVPMHFPLSTYAGDNVAGSLDQIKDLMHEITGEEMGDNVRVNGKPNFYNFKILVDVYPFRNNRHWHVTAGIFAGSNRIATALNAKHTTNTLVAMNIYNRFYNRMAENGYENEPFFGDIYLTEEKYNQLMSYGELGIHLGEYKDGRPYYLKPASNGTVSAKAYANAVRPYLGFGYSGFLDKEQKWQAGMEAGVLFWGGAPQVILNDGTNMNKELKNVRGKVGTYLGLIKALPVYPSVGFKLTYTIM